MNIKKNLLLLPGILLISCSLTALAEEKCAEVVGNMIVGKATLGCTKVTGSATLKHSTFTGNLNVIGPLKADSSKLDGVNVSGDTTLDHSIVSGVIHINGKLIATDTLFKQKLQANTLSITLVRSRTEDIEIVTNPSHETAYVYLNEGSIVNGNITFRKGHGIVKNNHATLNGKVIGGKIE